MTDFSTKFTVFTDEDSGHIFYKFYYSNMRGSIYISLKFTFSIKHAVALPEYSVVMNQTFHNFFVNNSNVSSTNFSWPLGI